MEKIEFPKKEDSSKISHFSARLFAILKFILGACFLSLVYASSVSFWNEFRIIEKPSQNYFWAGVITLLVIHLFVWEPNKIYVKGQRLLEIIFTFFKPLIKIAPYLLPVYTIILFIVYGILSFILRSAQLVNFFLLLSGFSIALHLVFSAKSIRAKQNDCLKADYIFGFSLIYILNLALLAFGLSLIFENFSFVNFFNNSIQISQNIFGAVFKQLFL
jgi:hypothetical protein